MKAKKIDFKVDEKNCHICISHRPNTKGYPTIKRFGKRYLMSRFLWEQKYGPIPEGMCILHLCDTPMCINTDHFFLGSQLDNLKDMSIKGRRAKGEMFHRKLSREQVLQIRNEPGNHQDIAKKYGVSRPTVCEIKTRRKWKWL